MSEAFFLKLNQFEGPLDLLLHLIKAHELNIFDIDIFVLSTQYLRYLRLIQFRHLKEAAAFVAMAATLVEIKTRSLLPNEKDGSEQALAELEEEETPEDDLRRRLIQFETFRQAAIYIDSLAQSQATYPNKLYLEYDEDLKDSLAPIKGDRHTLVILYEQLLSSLTDRKPNRVTAIKDSVLIDQIMELLHQMVLENKFLLFQRICAKLESRYELIVYILAFLQLVKDKRICCNQETAFGPIWLFGPDQDQLELHLEQIASQPASLEL